VSESARPAGAAEAPGAGTAGIGAARVPAQPEVGPVKSAGATVGPEARAGATAGVEASRDQGPEEAKNSFTALAGNTALLSAVLIYMGWNYENSLLEYFQVPAFSVSIGTVELALKGLVPLFESGVVFFAALLVAVLALASKAGTVRGLASEAMRKAASRVCSLMPKAIGGAVGRMRAPADWMLITGLLMTAVVLPLSWANVSGGTFLGWFARNRDGVYFVLALLAVGQLLSAWPIRRSGVGLLAYPLALIAAAMCTLWAAGIYADSLGSQAARSFSMDLPRQTGVTVYSVTSLDLSGPGVTCDRVRGATGYPYVCTGLRLLYVQSDTYDLLPVRWTPQDGHTFILDDSNQIRIEFSVGS
jgi:hypothetical protein